MNDGWMYQGRQYHQWFGHGTKPKDSEPGKDAAAGPMAARIGALGHTLIAGLPASKRYHPGARLGPDDHARLGRLMTAAVRALPLGPRRTAARVFGNSPDASGMTSLFKAAHLLKGAATQSDLRDATDELARGVQAIGLDRFKPFLREADAHLAAQGGVEGVARDLPKEPQASAPPAPPSGPAVAVEPEHGRIWWWFHNLGLNQTRHEKAVLLRRAMGSANGGVYVRDGQVLDMDNMSDDEVIALDKATRGQPPVPLTAIPDNPNLTSWGWRNAEPYNEALRQIDTPGTHETLNGRVPTIAEARRMIEENGGTFDRYEQGHHEGSNSTHNRPHINYRTSGNKKATVYVKVG